MLNVTLKWAQTICVTVHTFFKPAPGADVFFRFIRRVRKRGQVFQFFCNWTHLNILDRQHITHFRSHNSALSLHSNVQCSNHNEFFSFFLNFAWTFAPSRMCDLKHHCVFKGNLKSLTKLSYMYFINYEVLYSSLVLVFKFWTYEYLAIPERVDFKMPQHDIKIQKNSPIVRMKLNNRNF